jgi:hypothetical protein
VRSVGSYSTVPPATIIPTNALPSSKKDAFLCRDRESRWQPGTVTTFLRGSSVRTTILAPRCSSVVAAAFFKPSWQRRSEQPSSPQSSSPPMRTCSVEDSKSTASSCAAARGAGSPRNSRGVPRGVQGHRRGHRDQPPGRAGPQGCPTHPIASGERLSRVGSFANDAPAVTWIPPARKDRKSSSVPDFRPAPGGLRPCRIERN